MFVCVSYLDEEEQTRKGLRHSGWHTPAYMSYCRPEAEHVSWTCEHTLVSQIKEILANTQYANPHSDNNKCQLNSVLMRFSLHSLQILRMWCVSTHFLDTLRLFERNSDLFDGLQLQAFSRESNITLKVQNVRIETTVILIYSKKIGGSITSGLNSVRPSGKKKEIYTYSM